MMRPGFAWMLLTLGGCTLVDQNTFNSHAGDAPVVAPVPVVAAPPTPDPLALLTIFDTAGAPPGVTPATKADIHRAVVAARARKPDMSFDVTAIVAPDATTAGPDAPAIARAIVDDGVSPSRVHLAARPEAGASGREVRVFVH